MRRPAIVLGCALALLLAAGCGGSSSTSASGTESAATIAPASAAAYVAVDTDLESGQWQQAQDLLDRFPGQGTLLAEIQKSLGEEDVDFRRDVEPALGPETAIVVLTGGNDVVGLTKPEDPGKLRALLAKLNAGGETYVLRELDGWWAVAESEAVLNAFQKASDAGTLDGDQTFQDAVAELPEAAIVKAYISGKAIQDTADQASNGSSDVLTGGGRVISVSLALEALDEGVKLSGSSQLEGGTRPEAYEPTLLERVPDDALAVLSFKNLKSGVDQARSAEGVGPALGQVEQVFGVSVDELAGLFEGETMIYLRAGTPLPEVTLLLDVEDEAAALKTVDGLAARAAALLDARTGSTEVGGDKVSYVDIQGIRVSYTTFDGLLVLTSGAAGIRDARADGDKLSGDDRFSATKEAAGLGDTTSGFFYLDLKDAIPLLQGFADLADQQLPPEVSANLEPLDSFLVQASQDGDTISFGGFLGVSQ